MKISFKQFNDFVETDDLTEERVDEIFGIFRNSEKIEKLKAEREALLAKRKEEQKKKDAIFKNAKKRIEDEEQWEKERGKVTMRSQASQGRAAELDWVRGMQEGLEKPMFDDFKPMNKHDFMAFQGAEHPASGKALIAYGDDGDETKAIVLSLDDDKRISVALEDEKNGRDYVRTFDDTKVGYAQAHEYAGKLRARLNQKMQRHY
jgi:hypothetical protein